MDSFSVKIKLAVLWTSIVVTNLAIVIITFLSPNVIDNIRAGSVLGAEIGPNLLLLIAFTYFWVPVLLTILSITLNDSINRWANLIAGILYALFVLNELVSNIVKTSYLYGFFLQSTVIFILGAIIWFSIKWTGKSK